MIFNMIREEKFEGLPNDASSVTVHRLRWP